MSSEGPKKGRRFEDRVGEVLEILRSRHPGFIKVSKQPRISLNDGQEVCPDFELQFELPFEVAHYLVECQDRKRSKADIAHKIRYIKALSQRNRFIFVYSTSLPVATRKVLDADGVLVMSLDELAAFLAKVEATLTAVQYASRGMSPGYFEERYKLRMPLGSYAALLA